MYFHYQVLLNFHLKSFFKYQHFCDLAMNSFEHFILIFMFCEVFWKSINGNVSLFLRILNIKGESSQIRAAVRMIAEKLQEVGDIL